MTKHRVSRRARKKKPGSHRTKSRIIPARKIGVFLPWIITCTAIIAVVVTAGLCRNISKSQTEETSAVSDSNEPDKLSSGRNLTAQEQDRVLRKEQLEVASRLLTDFSNDTNAAFLMGMAYFEQGNVAEAEEYLKKSLEFLPNRADASDHLGRIALLKGQYERALMLFRRALENDPATPGIHFRIAKAHVFLGNFKEAVLELQKDIEIFPDSSESYLLLGETYQQLKEYQKAKENFEAVIRIRPDYAKVYYGLAIVCARLGLRDESRASQQKFKHFEAEDRKAGRHWRQVLDPLMVTRRSVAHTHTDIGRVYHNHGYSDKAEQLWIKAAVLDPNNVECRFHLAALYLQNRKFLDALKLYEHITGIDPNNGVAYFFIGNINARINLFDNAEKAYRKVIEVASKRSDGYRALAQLYLQNNCNLPEAKNLASKAVELGPAGPNYFILAAACDKNGDRAGAISAIERAIELEPGNQQYRRMQLMIREKK
jgi:tetratricopeptide (TPR) repeat protein